MDRFPLLATWNMDEMPATVLPSHRIRSPVGACSTLTQLAPWSTSIPAASGPVRATDRSTILIPSMGPGMGRR